MWTLQFKDINESTITVEIEGGNGTLTGAAEPLVTRELETDDPFDPVRYQTGYINLVGTDGADIRPESTFDRPVTIKKNGQIVWVGYIAVEEWNNSLSALPKTVSLPLISALGVLDCVEYIPASIASSYKRVGDIMAVALRKGFIGRDDMWRNIYIGRHTTNVLTSMLNDNAFASPADRNAHYRGMNPDLKSRKQSYTALDVVKEICKVYGWQCRENGLDIWLTTPDMGGTLTMIPFTSISSGTSGTLVTGSNRALSFASTNQSRSVLSARNQVRIKATCEPIPEELISLNKIVDSMTFSNLVQSFNSGNLKNYFAETFNNGSSPYLSIKHPNNNLVAGNIQARQQSEMNIFGAVLCKDAYFSTGVSDLKRVPSTSPCLTVSKPINDSDSERIAFTLYSDYYYFDCDGFIDFQVDFNAFSYYDELRENSHDAIEFKVMYAYFSYGDKFFNGTSWVNKSDYSMNPINTLPFPSEGADIRYMHICQGKPIPLPQGPGRFVVEFYAPNRSDTKYLRYSQISLILRPALYKSGITDYGELRYNADCNANSKSIYEVEHKLFFDNSPAPAVLSYCRINASDTIVRDTCGRMQTWYSKGHTLFQVDVIGTDFEPADTAYISSNNCFIGARQINWRDSQTRLTLFSI